MKNLPFNSVLQKSLHLGERGDNSDVQSFHLVFTVWIAAKEEEGLIALKK